MAVKAIYDLEIRDEAFNKFADAFKEYTKLLEATPADLEKMNAAAGRSGEAFAAGAASVAAISEEIHRAIRGQESFASAARKSDIAMASLAGHAKSVASSIASFSRFVGVAGVGGLLAGAAGLFGMDKLAHTVFSQRRFAQGVGVTTGQEAAFRVNYGQYVDPDALLGSVANARNDLGMQWAFQALGIGRSQEDRLNNADLSAEVTRHARDIWLRGPQTQQYAEAHGLTQFFSMDDLRRLGAASGADLAASEGRYRSDQGSMTVSDATQRGWVEFSMQLRRAGIQLETTFVKGLAPLTQPLEHLSKAATKFLGALMGSPAVKKAIDLLADALGSKALLDGVNAISDYLGSPAFREAFRSFCDDVEMAAQKIAAALRWLGMIPDGDPAQSANNPKGSLIRGEAWLREHVYNPAVTGPVAERDFRAATAAATKAYGLPPGLLDRLANAEWNPGDKWVSSAGAIGRMQITPGTAEMLGVDPNNPEASAQGAGHYLAMLRDRYGGDWRKTIAAYNWGPANVDADIKAHSGDWEKYLPKETQRELAATFPAGGNQSGDLATVLNRLNKNLAARTTNGVQITVTNDTSARVAVTANQVAPP